MILLHGSRLVAIGLAVGLATSFAATRLIASFFMASSPRIRSPTWWWCWRWLPWD
ncbi:MAG: hypothetical protein ACRD2P_06900 [Terriglobia bacterium]